MTSWMRTLVAALAAVLVAQAPLSGHNGIAVFVTVTPGRPGAGQACQISVVAIGPTGALASARVTLIGEMTGHPMPPRANLQPTVAKGRYAGEMTFTMAGPWKMTLEVDHLLFCWAEPNRGYVVATVMWCSGSIPATPLAALLPNAT